MTARHDTHRDAYDLVLDAIDQGIYRPGDRLVESELAERFGVSRTPVREALQRLETQSLLTRDGRSLIVASLDHAQMAELYAVRQELEGLAAKLAAQHAAAEEIEVLRDMVEADRALLGDPEALARANRRFHNQIHLASHNRFLVQQLDLVYRSMALMARTSLAAAGRGERRWRNMPPSSMPSPTATASGRRRRSRITCRSPSWCASRKRPEKS
jgi:DNA-binding GntR family transcriptional regulator